VRSDIDFVITYEELIGMFAAKGIDVGLVEGEEMSDASAGGGGFAAPRGGARSRQS